MVSSLLNLWTSASARSGSTWSSKTRRCRRSSRRPSTSRSLRVKNIFWHLLLKELVSVKGDGQLNNDVFSGVWTPLKSWTREICATHARNDKISKGFRLPNGFGRWETRKVWVLMKIFFLATRFPPAGLSATHFCSDWLPIIGAWQYGGLNNWSFLSAAYLTRRKSKQKNIFYKRHETSLRSNWNKSLIFGRGAGKGFCTGFLSQ